MGELYDKIDILCKKRNLSPADLHRVTGIRQQTLSDLKHGRQTGLSAKNIDKLANYFNVSASYLLGTETEKAPSEDGAELAEYLEDLRQRPETRALLEASRGMTRDQVEKMAEFAKMLRGGGNE